LKKGIGVTKNGRLVCVEFTKKRPIRMCGGCLIPMRMDRFMFLRCTRCGKEIHTIGVDRGLISGVGLYLLECNTEAEKEGICDTS